VTAIEFATYPLDSLIEPKAPEERRPRTYLYATELGKCPRAVWHDYHLGKRPDPAFEEYRAPLGHAVEDMESARFGKLVKERETKLRSELTSGRVDFVLVVEGQEVPLELKSTYVALDSPKLPMRSHVLQCAFYLSRMPSAPFALLRYVGLGYSAQGRSVTFVVERMDAEVRATEERLWKIVQGPEPPACERADCFDCKVSSEVSQ
jgi:CRISPR/Cas system-associated exonuclease Cas4 (RecB family)